MIISKTDIEVKLRNIFLTRLGLDFEAMERNAVEDQLLGLNIQLAPRDLLYIFVDVEKEFNITIPESEILEGQFNTFSGIVKSIKIQIEE